LAIAVLIARLTKATRARRTIFWSQATRVFLWFKDIRLVHIGAARWELAGLNIGGIVLRLAPKDIEIGALRRCDVTGLAEHETVISLTPGERDADRNNGSDPKPNRDALVHDTPLHPTVYPSLEDEARPWSRHGPPAGARRGMTTARSEEHKKRSRRKRLELRRFLENIRRPFKETARLTVADIGRLQPRERLPNTE